MEKHKSYWDYISLFEKYKKDCSIFFESGTHQGESVYDALYLKFEKIISVEIEKHLYNSCVEKFKNFSNVHLFCGDSNILMPEMLKLVDKKTLFWLDGHYGNGSPIWKELEFLETLSSKNHTIIIDDINSLYSDQVEDLKKSILKVNSNYKFVMEPRVKCLGNPSHTDSTNLGHLVAYID